MSMLEQVKVSNFAPRESLCPNDCPGVSFIESWACMVGRDSNSPATRRCSLMVDHLLSLQGGMGKASYCLRSWRTAASQCYAELDGLMVLLNLRKLPMFFLTTWCFVGGMSKYIICGQGRCVWGLLFQMPTANLCAVLEPLCSWRRTMPPLEAQDVPVMNPWMKISQVARLERLCTSGSCCQSG